MLNRTSVRQSRIGPAVRAGAAALLFAAAALQAGCYLIHGLGEDGREDPPSPRRRDAGWPSEWPDGGPPPTSRTDALPPTMDGGPLPDDEPDVLPGERPSDDPDSGEWRDPPAPSDDICCDVGPVVGVDDPDRQASPPVVAWNGAEWGVSWSDTPAPAPSPDYPRRLVFRRLARDAHPVSGLQALDGFDASPLDLTWGNHRYALLTQVLGFRRTGPGHLVVLDRDGVPRAVTWVPEAQQGSVIERYPAVHGWAVVAHLYSGGGEELPPSRLLLFDESLHRLPIERDLGPTVPADWRGVAMVGVKSRLAVAQATPDGIRLRVFVGDDAEENSAASALVWPGTHPTERGLEVVASAVGATRLRDNVVAAYLNRRDVNVVVFDPFGGGLLHGPVPVAASAEHFNPGIAGDDVTGVTGICYPYGANPPGGPTVVDPDAIRFVAVGPDGIPLGPPVTIAEGLRYVASCDVGVAGPGEFVVLFWNAARDERRHSISAATVRLRL